MARLENRWKSWLWRSSWLLLIPALPWLTRQFVFQAKSLPANHSFQFTTAATEVYLTTADTVRIHALYFEVEAPKGLVLYFHGNADNLDRWGKYAQDFVALGYAVLMIEYRGYGKSESTRITEDGLFADAKAGYDWARQHFDAADIVIYGRSLGSGIANQLATQVPARQLMLETPYYSIEAMVGFYMPLINPWLTKEYPLRSHRYLLQHQLPTTIFHGTKDRVVPYGEGKRLAALRPSARFVTIPGGNHKNLNQFPLYREALAEALRNP